MLNFKLNKLDNNIYQIYGQVNGFAIKHYEQGIYAYHIEAKFILGHKLIGISTSPKDNTMRNEEAIIKRIEKIVNEELNKDLDKGKSTKKSSVKEQTEKAKKQSQKLAIKKTEVPKKELSK